MADNETNIVRECLIRASKLNARLWRQQSGMGWIGKTVRIDKPQMISVAPGDVVIRQARPFHAGFEGLSDTGGYCMVDGLPVITQVEVKTATGTVRPEQRKWISFIRSIGGRAGIARCADDVDRIIAGERLD
jgi:hypothetical protein